MALDTDRIDEAVLALLYLGLHDQCRAWKGFDWDAMDRLHKKGMIDNPVNKASPWYSLRKDWPIEGAIRKAVHRVGTCAAQSHRNRCRRCLGGHCYRDWKHRDGLDRAAIGKQPRVRAIRTAARARGRSQ